MNILKESYLTSGSIIIPSAINEQKLNDYVRKQTLFYLVRTTGMNFLQTTDALMIHLNAMWYLITSQKSILKLIRCCVLVNIIRMFRESRNIQEPHPSHFEIRCGDPHNENSNSQEGRRIVSVQ
jgi:hypothetical protein